MSNDRKEYEDFKSEIMNTPSSAVCHSLMYGHGPKHPLVI